MPYSLAEIPKCNLTFHTLPYFTLPAYLVPYILPEGKVDSTVNGSGHVRSAPRATS